MAIAAQGGNASNDSTGSATSLALASYTTTTGRAVVIVVVLGSTASSVSSIASSAGSYSWTMRAAQNGTGVRVEIWTSPVNTGAATVFTINITGGATTIEGNLEEYSGVSSIGNTGTNSGSSAAMRGSATTQDQSNYTVSGLGFACQSGDTLAVSLGTSRQSSIPAATAVGGALYDNTSLLSCTLAEQADISASRNWASATVELRSGSAAITAVDYAGTSAPVLQTGHPDVSALHFLEPLFAQSNTGTGNPVPLGSILQSATVSVAYSETLTAQGGTSPYSFSVVSGSLPSGLSLNSSTGVISGTPTTAATFTFTIQVVDGLGRTNSQAFQIIVGSSSGGGEFNYACAA